MEESSPRIRTEITRSRMLGKVRQACALATLRDMWLSKLRWGEMNVESIQNVMEDYA
jgi:hypothetical protein